MSNARFPIYKFQQEKRLNPYWSSYICFCEALKGAPNISKRTLKKYFNLLVEIDDYAKKDKEQIIEYLRKTFLSKDVAVSIENS